MGARWSVMRAVVGAAALAIAARSGASVVSEPIARLSLEGGYDSNVLLDGAGADRVGRISPDVGFRARDHLWNFAATYGGDWVVYERRASNGFWNHRGALAFDARPAHRLAVRGEARLAHAQDPVGLALLGVFRSGYETAWFGTASARAAYRLTHRLEGALRFQERLVRFDRSGGGAHHASAVEATWRMTPRLGVGADYQLSAFQTFLASGGSRLDFAHAVHARAGYELSRRLRVDFAAGPALWTGQDGTGVVPEARLTLGRAGRRSDLHVTAAHGLGIGSVAAPAVVTSLEVGAERRLGRRYLLRGDAGLWRSGRAPGGEDATLGWAGSGEAAMLLGGGVRASLVATSLARLDDPSPSLARTTVSVRLGWELEAR
jgi:hypothetical protein